jgi:hypothetical protein
MNSLKQICTSAGIEVINELNKLILKSRLISK